MCKQKAKLNKMERLESQRNTKSEIERQRKNGSEIVWERKRERANEWRASILESCCGKTSSKSMLKCKQRGKYLIIVISVHVLSLTLWVIRVHSHNVVLHTSENIFTATRSCYAHPNTETNKSCSFSLTHSIAHWFSSESTEHGARMCMGLIPERRNILSDNNR